MKHVIRHIWLCLLCSLCLMSIACAKAPDAIAAYAPQEAQRLIVYTSHKQEVYDPIIKEFEDRYDIWVSVETGGTNELLERIATEAGRGTCDVMFGGGVESLESYKQYFTPYSGAGSEAIDPAFRCEDGAWTPFSSLPIVLIYNTKLVAQNELKGWADLLDPKWKGRIAFADPAVSGSSFTALSTLLQIMHEREDALALFAQNLDGKQLAGSGDVISAVVDGRLPVGVTLEETALRRIDALANIALVYPEEGTSAVPDGCALIKDAPHEENAKLFLDFIVDRDVQSRVAQGLWRRSVRSDTDAAEGIASIDTLHLIRYRLDWASRSHDSILDRWAALCGGEAQDE